MHKFVVIKCYNATDEDWRNPNVYIDTDPSDSSCDSENESADNDSYRSKNALLSSYFDYSVKNNEGEPLPKIANLNVTSEVPTEEVNSSSDSRESQKLCNRANSSCMNSNALFRSDQAKKQNCVYAAQPVQFPSRKFIRGRRNLLSKTENNSATSVNNNNAE